MCPNATRLKSTIAGLYPKERSKSVNPLPQVLIFDYNLIGFARRYKNRFNALGVKVLEVKGSWSDFIIDLFAERNDGIIVTRDRDFSLNKRAVVLTKTKYEELWTELWKKIRFL